MGGWLISRLYLIRDDVIREVEYSTDPYADRKLERCIEKDWKMAWRCEQLYGTIETERRNQIITRLA